MYNETRGLVNKDVRLLKIRISIMPRFLQDIVALLIYLFFGAVEILIVFGMLLVAFSSPCLVADYFGAETGSNMMIIALLIGACLAVAWYLYLDNGGRELIQNYFRNTTHRVIRKLGAGDAIYDD